uniref:Gamma-tubulin complex component n=1 Tax=Rhabditophanes sp. KR3021 TaxID=114890 RepID=A0AC35TUE6_9BILA
MFYLKKLYYSFQQTLPNFEPQMAEKELAELLQEAFPTLQGEKLDTIANSLVISTEKNYNVLDRTIAKCNLPVTVQSSVDRMKAQAAIKDAKGIMETLLYYKFSLKKPRDGSSHGSKENLEPIYESVSRKRIEVKFSDSMGSSSSSNPLFSSQASVYRQPIPKEDNSKISDADLIRNTLTALQGIESILFRQYVADSESVSKSNGQKEMKFHFSAFTRSGLKPEIVLLVEEILCTAWSYTTIESMLRGSSSDSIAHAFMKGIRSCVDVYFKDAAALYQDFMMDNASVNLFRIYKFSQIWKEPLTFLYKLCDNYGHTQGLDILNKIYETWIFRPRGDITSDFLKTIVNIMFAEFHSTLKMWLFRGQVPDGETRWIITKNNDVSESRRWEDWVVLNKNKLPISLNTIGDVLEKILSIGRTVLFLMESSSSQSYDSQEEQRVKLFEQLHPSKSYYKLSHRSIFSKTIFEMNRLVSADMVNTILNDYHFGDHLETLRRHFLLTCPAYFDNIHDTFEGCNEHDDEDEDHEATASELSSTPFLAQRVHYQAMSFDEAIRLADSWRGLRIEKFFMIKDNDSDCTTMSAQTTGNGTNLTGNTTFNARKVHVTYRPTQPISIILNEISIQLYERFFKILFLIRSKALKIDRIHTELRDMVYQVRRGCPKLIPLIYKFMAKIHVMSLFVNKLLYYCYYDVIPTAQQALEENLLKVTGLEDIMKYHTEYLEIIKNGLFTSRKSKKTQHVMASIIACLKNIDQFTGVTNKLVEFWEVNHNDLYLEGANSYKKKDVTDFELEENDAKRIELVDKFERENKSAFYQSTVQFDTNVKNLVGPSNFFYNSRFSPNWRNRNVINNITDTISKMTISSAETTDILDSFLNFTVADWEPKVQKIINEQTTEVKAVAQELWNSYGPPATLLSSLNALSTETKNRISELIKNGVYKPVEGRL